MSTLYELEKTRPPFDTAARSRRQSARHELRQNARAGAGLLSRSAAPRRRHPGVERALASAFPGATSRASTSTSPSPCRAAKRENGHRLARAVPLRFAGLLRTLGVPLIEGRDFRDSTRTARSAWSSSARASPISFSRPGPAQPRKFRWTDPVMKFIGISLRAAPHHRRRPRHRRRKHYPRPGHDHLSARRPGRLERPSLRPRQAGSLLPRARHRPHHS
jgi:hypothetical protein